MIEFEVGKNRQPFCILCPKEHEKKCRCGHEHHLHNFAGGCVQCLKLALIGKKLFSDVCDLYDQRPKLKKVV